MPYRHWMHVPAPLGILIILGAMLVAVVLVVPLERQDRSEPIRAEKQAGQTKTDPAEKIGVPQNGLIGSYKIPSELTHSKEAQKAADTAQAEKERTQQDLKAQKDMARWALWMVAISSVSAIIAAFAVWLVYLTLRETRNLGQVQLRAYMFPTKAIVKMTAKGRFSATVTFENTGQTPASQFQAWASVGIHEYPLKGQIISLQPFHLSNSAIRPGGDPSLDTKTRIASNTERNAVAKSDRAIYLNGNFEYFDVFKKKRPLKFRFMYTGPWGGEQTMMVCPTGNEDT